VLAGVRCRYDIINRKLLLALTIIIISNFTLSVSKYKPLNNIKYLCDNCVKLRTEILHFSFLSCKRLHNS